MSDENFITTFNHGYNGAAFVLLSDHKAEVQRLTNERDAKITHLQAERDAMREQLRWRKWPDEKPESWPVLVVDTLGYKAVIYKIERVACTDGTDPMCWITDTGYLRADICPSWLPIPQGGAEGE